MEKESTDYRTVVAIGIAILYFAMAMAEIELFMGKLWWLTWVFGATFCLYMLVLVMNDELTEAALVRLIRVLFVAAVLSFVGGVLWLLYTLLALAALK
jgi:hypothetical protein